MVFVKSIFLPKIKKFVFLFNGYCNIWYMDCGAKIKEIRKAQKLSQTKFGKIFGVKQTTVGSWESNTYPDLETIIKICNHFKIPAWKFFMDEQEIADEYKIPKYWVGLYSAFMTLTEDQRDQIYDLVLHQIQYYDEKSRKLPQ